MQGLELDVYLIDPVGYFEMLWLLKRCQLVLTDSGGVQKEAFFAGKPCVTMRDQTEWVELLELGGNVLVGSDGLKIIDAVRQSLGKRVKDVDSLYGGGQAAKRIVEELLKI
jgi:UDP-GlcNAc3NAcA epimerase